jgi:hypothetical protein
VQLDLHICYWQLNCLSVCRSVFWLYYYCLPGIELSDSVLLPTQTKKMTRLGHIFVLNTSNQHVSKFSRRRSLKDCDTLPDFHAVLSSLSGMFEKALAVRGKNGSGASFRNARNESLNLKNVNLQAIYARLSNNTKESDPGEQLLSCFRLLRGAMRLHACLEFDRPLPGTTAELGGVVAYHLGGRVLTLAEVGEAAELGVSPFQLGVDMPGE